MSVLTNGFPNNATTYNTEAKSQKEENKEWFLPGSTSEPPEKHSENTVLEMGFQQ